MIVDDIIDALDPTTTVAESAQEASLRAAALERLADRYRAESRRDRDNRADLRAAAAAADRLAAELRSGMRRMPTGSHHPWGIDQ